MKIINIEDLRTVGSNLKVIEKDAVKAALSDEGLIIGDQRVIVDKLDPVFTVKQCLALFEPPRLSRTGHEFRISRVNRCLVEKDQFFAMD
jgi:hypothetical protein